MKTRLSEQERKMIELVYGLNGNRIHSVNELASLYCLSNKQIKDRINELSIKLNNILDQASKPNRWEDLSIIYDTEAVNEAFAKLTKNKQSFIEYYFGLNGNTPLSDKKLCNLLKITVDRIDKVVNDVIKEIVEIINKNNLLSIRKKQFYNVLITDNKEKINDSLKILDYEELKLVFLYYGIDDKNVLDLDDLAKEFNCDNDSLLAKIEELNKKLNKHLQSISYRK